MAVHVYPAAIARLADDADVKAAIEEVAERIAGHIDGLGITVGGEEGSASEYALPVKVFDRDGETTVELAHPAGVAVQAKHGALTKGASAEGLKVR